MKNFVMIEENVFTDLECLGLIELYKRQCTKADKDYLGYNYFDITSFNFIDRLNSMIDKYKTKFKEIDLTASKWSMTSLRFKHFEPEKSFNSWHSEHSLTYPYRILNIQIYLTTHNCGTEFYDSTVIKSKQGTVALFPAYFTHTHRGQVCPNKKDRYLITGYLQFDQKGNLE